MPRAGACSEPTIYCTMPAPSDVPADVGLDEQPQPTDACSKANTRPSLLEACSMWPTCRTGVNLTATTHNRPLQKPGHLLIQSLHRVTHLWDWDRRAPAGSQPSPGRRTLCLHPARQHGPCSSCPGRAGGRWQSCAQSCLQQQAGRMGWLTALPAGRCRTQVRRVAPSNTK